MPLARVAPSGGSPHLGIRAGFTSGPLARRTGKRLIAIFCGVFGSTFPRAAISAYSIEHGMAGFW